MKLRNVLSVKLSPCYPIFIGTEQKMMVIDLLVRAVQISIIMIIEIEYLTIKNNI